MRYPATQSAASGRLSPLAVGKRPRRKFRRFVVSAYELIRPRASLTGLREVEAYLKSRPGVKLQDGRYVVVPRRVTRNNGGQLTVVFSVYAENSAQLIAQENVDWRSEPTLTYTFRRPRPLPEAVLRFEKFIEESYPTLLAARHRIEAVQHVPLEEMRRRANAARP